MPRTSCDTTGILISKYVDNEAAPDERALIEMHVAGCEECAQKLTSFMEMAAIFTDAGNRMPQPHVRLSLFSRIERVKIDEDRAKRLSSLPVRAAPTNLTSPAVPSGGFLSRLRLAAGPFAAFGAAILVVLAVIGVIAQLPRQQIVPVPQDVTRLIPEVLPTIPYAEAGSSSIAPPVVTKTGLQRPATATRSATARSTGRGESVLELQRPTPVFERGNVADWRDWHLVRDPRTGYGINYPPNWWTQVVGNKRTFLPWGPGGSEGAPYWLDVEVTGNPDLLNAESANETMLSGTCTPINGTRNGSSCRRGSYAEGNNNYDELYAFDARHIYILRLAVPTESPYGDFQTRWAEAQLIFSRMSGSLALAPESSSVGHGYGPILFLNGTDLWATSGASNSASAVTRGYGVLNYSLSPDLRRVAFSATNSRTDPNAPARYLYLTNVENGTNVMPILLWQGVELFDLAWYGDRELIVIARGDADGLALYRINVTADTGTGEATRTLLLSLDRALMGARGLAVSPDRQLITFIAPLRELEGTDVYAVRPDGTDLVKLVSHDEVSLPQSPGPDSLRASDLAVKRYVWTAGRLESDGYAFSMLFICGNNTSYTFNRGGYLYSAPGGSASSLLNPTRLGVSDAAGLQIVHVARSSRGRVAFSGIYNMRDGRPEVMAGLWTADLSDGVLTNIESLPIPAAPHGIADLEWSPDGAHLIYRETIPQHESHLVSSYVGGSPFLLVSLDPLSGERTVLFDAR